MLVKLGESRRMVASFSRALSLTILGACAASKTVTAPEPVSGGPTLVSLTAGGAAYAGGLTSDGTAYTWGENYFGQLGDGTTETRNSPVAVQGGLRFRSLTAGGVQTCGLTASGAAYCWGLKHHH